MTVITDYLSAGGWLRLSRRHDDTTVRYLIAHPGRTASEVAHALHRPVHRTHRRLRRLEREGRICSRWEGDGVFTHTVYHPSPQTGDER